jgi:hypothetical protein
MSFIGYKVLRGSIALRFCIFVGKTVGMVLLHTYSSNVAEKDIM